MTLLICKTLSKSLIIMFTYLLSRKENFVGLSCHPQACAYRRRRQFKLVSSAKPDPFPGLMKRQSSKPLQVSLRYLPSKHNLLAQRDLRVPCTLAPQNSCNHVTERDITSTCYIRLKNIKKHGNQIRDIRSATTVQF